MSTKTNKKDNAEAPADVAVDVTANDGFTELEKASGELGSDEIQQATDEAEAKGYIGVKTDPRPNEDYTVAGVLAAREADSK